MYDYIDCVYTHCIYVLQMCIYVYIYMFLYEITQLLYLADLFNRTRMRTRIIRFKILGSFLLLRAKSKLRDHSTPLRWEVFQKQGTLKLIKWRGDSDFAIGYQFSQK